MRKNCVADKKCAKSLRRIRFQYGSFYDIDKRFMVHMLQALFDRVLDAVLITDK